MVGPSSFPEWAILTFKFLGVLKKKKSQWYSVRNDGEEAVDTSASENVKHWGSHGPCLHTSFHKLKLNEQILIMHYHHKM